MAKTRIGELILICNHCGKEVESLSSAIAELHDQGMTATEIRDALHDRLGGSEKTRYIRVYSLLRGMGLTPRTKTKQFKVESTS